MTSVQRFSNCRHANDLGGMIPQFSGTLAQFNAGAP